MTRMKIEEVGNGIYAVIGLNGMPNAAFIDGAGEGAIVIDSLFTPQYAREMMSEVRTYTDDEVVALLNTHFHCDHVFGNPAVPTSRVVSHKNAKSKLEELGDDYVELIRQNRADLAEELKGVTLRLPTETFTDRLELSLGEETLDLRYTGVVAHTDNDISIRFSQSRILVAGDLVFNGIVPVQRDGDIAGLRSALTELNREKFDVVIPGHGAVGGQDLITQQIEFIDAVVSHTAEILENGGDIAQAKQSALQVFDDLMFTEQRIGDWIDQAGTLYEND